MFLHLYKLKQVLHPKVQPGECDPGRQTNRDAHKDGITWDREGGETQSWRERKMETVRQSLIPHSLVNGNTASIRGKAG